MPQSLPRTAAAVACVLIAVASARAAALQAASMFAAYHQVLTPRGLLAAVVFAMWLALANGAWMFGARVRATLPTPWRARAAWISAALIAAVWAIRVGQTVDTFDRMARDAPAVAIGSWPYQAGEVVEVEVQGEQSVAHIGADGSRLCGSPTDGPRIALIGDSFVFGKGVDDPGTLCAHLAGLGSGAHLINLGQPGANLQSYVRMLGFAAEHHHVDAAFVGVLIPDDSLPLDRFDQPWLVRQWWFVGLTAALDRSVMNALPGLFEVMGSDFLTERVLVHRLEALAAQAEATRTPTWVWIYGRRGLPVTHYAEVVDHLAATSPWLHPVGILAHPDDVRGAIPGDGHPTAEGNAWYAGALLPFVREAAEP